MNINDFTEKERKIISKFFDMNTVFNSYDESLFEIDILLMRPLHPSNLRLSILTVSVRTFLKNTPFHTMTHMRLYEYSGYLPLHLQRI